MSLGHVMFVYQSQRFGCLHLKWIVLGSFLVMLCEDDFPLQVVECFVWLNCFKKF